MQVTLIDFTVNAPKLLAFTKGTRLGLNYERALANLNTTCNDDTDAHPDDAIANELRYMAKTIPSSWEFVSYTFLIEGVSRAFTHQFVRNRHGSYAQESLRVTDKNDYEFVVPQRIADTPDWMRIIEAVNDSIKVGYKALTDLGCPAEDARSILPTNIATNIVARFNLRTMAELAASRTGGRTQNEYQRVMGEMVERILEVHPWAHEFLFGERDRNYFDEIEAFAEREYGGDLLKKGELLKIVDKMRKRK